MFLHALHGENTLIQAKLEPLPPVSEKKVTQCPWALNVSQIINVNDRQEFTQGGLYGVGANVS